MRSLTATAPNLLRALVAALLLVGLGGAVGLAARRTAVPGPGEVSWSTTTAASCRPRPIADAERHHRRASRSGPAREVVVYTQVKPEAIRPSWPSATRLALIDQWGIGRKGFDDGMAILFDLDESRRHGQVQLYAGPGYQAAYLSNEERQAIFENDMLPLPARRRPRRGRPGGDGQDRRQRDHRARRQTLQAARLINAVVGAHRRAAGCSSCSSAWAVLVAALRHGPGLPRTIRRSSCRRRRPT